MKFFIISYVNSLEQRKYVVVWFSYVPQRIQCWPAHIHTTWQWIHSGKRLCMCEIDCWRRSTWHTESNHRNEYNMDENDTKRIIQLCVKIKKRCYTDLFHFSTHKHNLVFFSRPNHILTVELRRIFFFIYSSSRIKC